MHNFIIKSLAINNILVDCQQSQQTMKGKFYFCFRFNAIALQNDIHNDFIANTNFQLQILRNRKSVGHTHDILCDPDLEGSINITDQFIRFTVVKKPHELSRNVCELRLVEIIPGGERILGGYQFVLENYIQASQDLNRSCMELRIELGENFIVDYVVYVQTTVQALDKITKEHQTAKKMHMIQGQDSNQDNFLSQDQIQEGGLQSEEETKMVQYDLQSPLIIRQKFWSPKRARKNPTGSELKVDPEKQQKRPFHSADKNQNRSKGFMKMKKVQSNLSDNTANTFAKKLFVRKQRKVSGLMEKQVQEFAEHEDPNRSIQELYQVICSDSKITVSPLDSQNEEQYKYPELKTIKTQKSTTFYDPWWKNIGMKNWIMIVILLVIILVFIVNNFRPSKKKNYRRNKKQPGKSKNKRHSRS